jgi:hypothetical protein
MRPGHIRVFDGLRITTEHVEHLQGALHSALQDLREIIGLGKVYHGFEVVAGNDQAITVQPGLAFDFDKNRIVCDEPKTLAVTFGPDAETQYVCIKYDQVEDGQVEGQFTLIWDNCAVVLRSTLPEPGENLIPIAQLNKSTADGRPFEIVSPFVTAPEPTMDAEEKAPPEKEAMAEAEDDEAMLALEALAEMEGTEEEMISVAAHPSSSEDEKTEAETLSAPQATMLKSEPWRLKVQQGILQLPSAAEKKYDLGASLLESLRRKVSSGEGNGMEVLLTLAEKEVPLEFPVSSLTCRTVISGAVSAATGTPASAAETPQYASLKFQSTANGEATFMQATVSQFGVAMVYSCPISGSGALPMWTSETTEAGIAHLPFILLRGALEKETTVTAWDILQHLQLLLSIDRSQALGFKVICNLLWKGGVNDEIIQKIQNQKFDFTWETLVAWKALGALPV